MTWTAELLNAANDDARLSEIVDTLQKELFENYETRNVAEGQRTLAELAALFGEDTDVAKDIADKTGLYLCAPCLACGVLSVDCGTLCSHILTAMLENASPREMFTGAVFCHNVVNPRSIYRLKGSWMDCPCFWRQHPLKKYDQCCY